MVDESFSVVLPLPVKSLQPNCTIGSVGGRFMKATAIKRYRRLACEAVQAEGVESFPWGKVLVTAAFFHKTDRTRDQDNAMGSLKAAYDGLVDAGVVEDDDFIHMERGVPTFGYDKISPRVVLTIKRLE